MTAPKPAPDPALETKPQTAPKTVQAEPTAPPPVDDDGHEVDAWGIPLAGPLRVARLAALGKPDPLIDPAAWAETIKD